MSIALAFSLAAWTFVAAQQTRVVVFPSRSVTVAEAFAEIERQTPYLISVGHTDFDMSRRVELNASELLPEAALKQLLADSDRTYTIRGEHIMVVPAPEAAVSPKPEPVKPEPVKVKPAETKPVPPAAEPVEVQPEPAREIPAAQPEVMPEPEIKPVIDPAEAAFLRRESARSAVNTGKLYRPMRFALKTNLLYAAATLTPNLSFEAGIGHRSTIDIGAGYNPWNMNGTESSNRKLGHWIVQPEYRWWLCERFNGHYFGAHVLGGMFNISEHRAPLLFGESNSRDYRYEGWFIGAGVSYGYQLMLARSWNLEFNVGVGYARLWYDRYEHQRCGELIQPDAGRNYFGPTKLGITLTYLIK